MRCCRTEATTQEGMVILREFVKLTSSGPPARVEGGSEQHFMTPFRRDPRDPRDRDANSPRLDFVRRRGT